MDNREYILLKNSLVSCGVLKSDGSLNTDYIESTRLTSGRLYVINQDAYKRLKNMETKLNNLNYLTTYKNLAK